MNKTILERRWFRLAVVLVAVATLAVLSARRPKLPGSLGGMAGKLHVGMSRDEAVIVMRNHYPRSERDLTTLLLSGRTRDGRRLSEWCSSVLDNMPSGDQIDYAEIIVDDDDYRRLIITFGPGGVVTELRLESDSIWEELRYGLAHGTGWSGWRSLTRERSQCFEHILRNFFDPD